MLRAGELAKVLASVDLVSLSGPWHRGIDHDYLTRPPPGLPAASPPQPLWAGGAKTFGARFTRKGSFETLYLSSDPVTAMLEVESIFRNAKGHLVSAGANPLTIFEVRGSLAAVLDLTDEDTSDALETDESELTGHWRGVKNPLTHRLGFAANSSGRILAVKSFSAKNAGAGTIVAVFSDLLRRYPPSFLEVVDSTGRLSQRIP